MKESKMIVVLTLVIIILIGIIYNLINTIILNDKKIILKEMSETEYENNISELNQSHMDYANYIQESKAQIANAITEMGVPTSDEETLETMANNIKSIVGDNSFELENFNIETKLLKQSTAQVEYTTDKKIIFVAVTASTSLEYNRGASIGTTNYIYNSNTTVANNLFLIDVEDYSYTIKLNNNATPVYIILVTEK